MSPAKIVSSPLPAPAIPTPPRRCRSICTRMKQLECTFRLTACSPRGLRAGDRESTRLRARGRRPRARCRRTAAGHGDVGRGFRKTSVSLLGHQAFVSRPATAANEVARQPTEKDRFWPDSSATNEDMTNEASEVELSAQDLRVVASSSSASTSRPRPEAATAVSCSPSPPNKRWRQ